MNFKRLLSDAVALALSLAVCFAAAAIGSFLTSDAVTAWYAGLRKSPLNPPNWVFAPVWTLLYTLMAVAAWLVWRRRDRPILFPLGLFALQLGLNVAWSWLFFYLHNPAAALVEIVALWLSILATATAFWRVSRPASYLLLPYLIWVGFAAVLNFAVWRLN